MTDHKVITDDPEYDAYCTQQLQNPYPFLARLRVADPVHWCEPLHMWIVTRHDDVLAGLKDTKRLISSRRGMYTDPLHPENRAAAEPLVDHLSLWLQNVNPPDHTRMRKLVNMVFTPRMLRELSPRIEQIVDELLDKIVAQEQTDFVQSFCLPLPSRVICEMLGIPRDQQARFRESVNGFVPFSTAAGPALNDAIGSARQGLDDLIAMFDGLITQRLENPEDDLISAMAAAQEDGDRLSRDEMFAMCVFIYVAGHETTASLLVGGTKALLERPDQFDLLKSDIDKWIDPAVEELVRYESPVTRGVRTPIEDIQLRDKTIGKGQTIMFLNMAANRDPEVFGNPDEIDITRKPNKHLGFGHGIHFCLGAPLARLEGQIAFRAIAQRLPSMQRVDEQAPYRPGHGIRFIESMQIRPLG